MKKKKSLEQRGLEWARKYGMEYAMPMDYAIAWTDGYKAGRRAKKAKRKGERK